MDTAQLPKIELHLHLDCSVSYQLVNRLDKLLTLGKFRSEFVAPAKCKDLVDYLERARSGVALMQSAEALRWVTLDLLNQLAADNVLYAEIRFAPLLHLQGGLSAKEVVRTVNNAVTEGSGLTGIECRLILCTLRHFKRNESMQTVRLVHEFAEHNVVGFDIAGDEAGFLIDEHIAAFDYAHKHDLNVTAHAGEAMGPESIWETIRHFKPARIGHGVRSVANEELMKKIQSDQIHLEICPTSNVQTNVCNRFEDHPIGTIAKAGISFSINTDGRTISNTTLTNEYNELSKNFGFGEEDFVKANLEAIQHSFLSKSHKRKLTQRYNESLLDHQK